MEFIKKEDIKILSNTDCDSHQLILDMLIKLKTNK